MDSLEIQDEDFFACPCCDDNYDDVVVTPEERAENLRLALENRGK